MAARSYLFVPGDQPDMLSKADHRGADALIADLEDAVAPSRKEEARNVTSAWLTGEGQTRAQRWVRINPGTTGVEDLRAIEDAAIDGVMVPKVADAGEVARWAGLTRAGQPFRKLIVLIETARALRDIDRIASQEGVWQLMIGEADLGADIGMSPGQAAWQALRVDVVVASAAAGLEPPIGPVDPDFSSPDRLEAETRNLKEMGYASRAVIHPAQIAPVHRGLAPTPTELGKARELLARYEEALARGEGVGVDEEGKLIDEAFMRRARRIVESADHSPD